MDDRGLYRHRASSTLDIYYKRPYLWNNFLVVSLKILLYSIHRVLLLASRPASVQSILLLMKFTPTRGDKLAFTYLDTLVRTFSTLFLGIEVITVELTSFLSVPKSFYLYTYLW